MSKLWLVLVVTVNWATKVKLKNFVAITGGGACHSGPNHQLNVIKQFNVCVTVNVNAFLVSRQHTSDDKIPGRTRLSQSGNMLMC